jgi:hypothetical protein
VDHPERRGGEGIHDEVPVAHRAERVRGCRREAEFRGDAFAVERIAAPRRPEPSGLTWATPYRLARSVALEHLDVREEVMARNTGWAG